MRAPLAALTLLCLLAGCGGGGRRGACAGADVDDGLAPARPAELVERVPTKAALDAGPMPACGRRLDAGEVTLVDLTGRIGIRPARSTSRRAGGSRHSSGRAGTTAARRRRAAWSAWSATRTAARARRSRRARRYGFRARSPARPGASSTAGGSRWPPTTPTPSRPRGWRRRAELPLRQPAQRRGGAPGGRGGRTAGTATAPRAVGTSGSPTGSSPATSPAVSRSASSGIATDSRSFEVPHHCGPPGVGSTRRTSRLPSAGLTTCSTQSVLPPRGATTRRWGPASSGTGTVGPSPCSRTTAGSGHEQTPNALPGASDATAAARRGHGETGHAAPSQVNANAALEFRQQRGEHPCGRCMHGAQADASEARARWRPAAAAASRGSRAGLCRASSGPSTRRPAASRSIQSGTIAITLPAACRPDVTTSTSTPACSWPGGSTNASIRPSKSSIRSGRSPSASRTDAREWSTAAPGTLSP